MHALADRQSIEPTGWNYPAASCFAETLPAAASVVMATLSGHDLDNETFTQQRNSGAQMKIESKIPDTGANGYDKHAAPGAVIAPANGEKPGLSREFYTVLADIEYLIKDIAQLTGDDLVRTGLKINEHIAAARKSVEAMGDTLAERTHKTVAVTNHYVQEQPWKAIGIGTAVGLIVGALLARRT